MTSKEPKRVGILIGREEEWPDAFLEAVNKTDQGVVAELVQIGGTFMDEECPYDVIVDRISNETPYYRVYLKYAALQNCYIINNPFVWSADSKFYGIALVNQLGMTTPRTVALPNKYIRLKEVGPDSFRNLAYPMDWEGIVNYVGVPAIFKDINSGGRHVVYRVRDVDELIQRYDESGTHTMILQQLIESDIHIHCLVIGQEEVLTLQYDQENGRYHPQVTYDNPSILAKLTQDARTLTRAYQYDINMVEFVIKDNQPYVINSTNPTPVIDHQLMTDEQFDWCINSTAKLVIERAHRPPFQKTLRDI
ncbi:MAG: hypothetical protein WBO48_22645 [Candidatus Promineifilaceae bacterium]|nr:hypothetical protein [Chloroflexota bacterium]MBK8932942.1 hypothetical protein [Chloroflexota bacterium]